MPPGAAKKKQGLWRYPVFILVAALVAATLYSGLLGSHNLFRLAELKKQKGALLQEIDSLETRRAELLAEKKRLLTDTAYLEKLARKELGMARPGEKVYRFVDPDPDGADAASRTRD